MNLTSQHEGSTLVVSVDEDRIDAVAAIRFKDRFREATSGWAGRIVLDLGSVAFIDSSGLGAIVAAMKLLAFFQAEVNFEERYSCCSCWCSVREEPREARSSSCTVAFDFFAFFASSFRSSSSFARFLVSEITFAMRVSACLRYLA